MEEFEQKYNESMALLQDAVTRLTDNLSLWRDQWLHLSDSEKSSLCSKSSHEAPTPQLDDSQAEVEDTPPPAVGSSETVDTTAAVIGSVRIRNYS